MFKRNSVVAFILLAALATLCLLAAVGTAQKGPNSTTGTPLKGGLDVKLGKNPGGSPAARKTNPDGKIPLSDLAPGSYWLEVVPLTNAQKAANADGEDYSYIVFTITGNTLVGKTITRSLKVDKWQFVNPRANTARTTNPDTYTNRMEFKIGPPTDGHPPSTETTIIKSKSNITNN